MQARQQLSLALHEVRGITTPGIALPTIALGIGRAIAIALAQSGANLSIIDLKVDTLADTAASCAKFGVKVKPYSCDVTQLHDCKKVFSQIEQDLGPVEYNSILVSMLEHEVADL